MKTAKWNGAILAQSNVTVVIEGNDYFPINTINKEYFKESDQTSHCHWKGEANYYDIEVDGKVNKDAAWYYKNPSRLADSIKDHVTFWNGVTVE